MGEAAFSSNVAARRVLAATSGLLLLTATLGGCGGDLVGSDEPASAASARLVDHSPVGLLRLTNGGITDAQTHFGAEAASHDWLDYDPVTDAGLLAGLTVVGSAGETVILTCPRDFPCPPYQPGSYSGAALGPGPDEVTTLVDDGVAQVIGYDGTRHQTIDLTATIADRGDITGLDWSPDGRLLAVTTLSSVGVRIWLVDSAQGSPELAHTVRTYCRPAGNPQWSPDGRALMLELSTGGLYGADVIVLRLQPDGAADPAITQRLFHSNRHFDRAGNLAWSPDGTRIAVRTRAARGSSKHHLTVISADDGSVVDHHPDVDGWLIWPAKES
jgi:hypothetical protein